MKTFKILFAAIIIAGFATSAMAQQNDNANVNAEATVLQQISVANQADLLFALVSPGVDKTIALDDEVTAGTETGGEQAGRFLVSAGASSEITLSFTDIPAVLTRDGGSETMAINYTSAWGVTTDGSGAANTVNVTEDALTTISTFPTNDAGGVNGIYVFLGGTVEPTTGQEAGVYEASIQLTAEYN
jgi:hypothetical protein